MIADSIKEFFFEMVKDGISLIAGSDTHHSEDQSCTRIFSIQTLYGNTMFIRTYVPKKSIISNTNSIDIDGISLMFRLLERGIVIYTDDSEYTFGYNCTQQEIDCTNFELKLDTECIKLIHGFKTYIDKYFIK